MKSKKSGRTPEKPQTSNPQTLACKRSNTASAIPQSSNVTGTIGNAPQRLESPKKTLRSLKSQTSTSQCSQSQEALTESVVKAAASVISTANPSSIKAVCGSVISLEHSNSDTCSRLGDDADDENDSGSMHLSSRPKLRVKHLLQRKDSNSSDESIVVKQSPPNKFKQSAFAGATQFFSNILSPENSTNVCDNENEKSLLGCRHDDTEVLPNKITNLLLTSRTPSSSSITSNEEGKPNYLNRTENAHEDPDSSPGQKRCKPSKCLGIKYQIHTGNTNSQTADKSYLGRRTERKTHREEAEHEMISNAWGQCGIPSEKINREQKQDKKATTNRRDGPGSVMTCYRAGVCFKKNTGFWQPRSFTIDDDVKKQDANAAEMQHTGSWTRENNPCNNRTPSRHCSEVTQCGHIPGSVEKKEDREHMLFSRSHGGKNDYHYSNDSSEVQSQEITDHSFALNEEKKHENVSSRRVKFSDENKVFVTSTETHATLGASSISKHMSKQHSTVIKSIIKGNVIKTRQTPEPFWSKVKLYTMNHSKGQCTETIDRNGSWGKNQAGSDCVTDNSCQDTTDTLHAYSIHRKPRDVNDSSRYVSDELLRNEVCNLYGIHLERKEGQFAGRLCSIGGIHRSRVTHTNLFRRISGNRPILKPLTFLPSLNGLEIAENVHDTWGEVTDQLPDSPVPRPEMDNSEEETDSTRALPPFYYSSLKRYKIGELTKSILSMKTVSSSYVRKNCCCTSNRMLISTSQAKNPMNRKANQKEYPKENVTGWNFSDGQKSNEQTNDQEDEKPALDIPLDGKLHAESEILHRMLPTQSYSSVLDASKGASLEGNIFERTEAIAHKKYERKSRSKVQQTDDADIYPGNVFSSDSIPSLIRNHSSGIMNSTIENNRAVPSAVEFTQLYAEQQQYKCPADVDDQSDSSGQKGKGADNSQQSSVLSTPEPTLPKLTTDSMKTKIVRSTGSTRSQMFPKTSKQKSVYQNLSKDSLTKDRGQEAYRQTSFEEEALVGDSKASEFQLIFSINPKKLCTKSCRNLAPVSSPNLCLDVPAVVKNGSESPPQADLEDKIMKTKPVTDKRSIKKQKCKQNESVFAFGRYFKQKKTHEERLLDKNEAEQIMQNKNKAPDGHIHFQDKKVPEKLFRWQKHALESGVARYEQVNDINVHKTEMTGKTKALPPAEVERGLQVQELVPGCEAYVLQVTGEQTGTGRTKNSETGKETVLHSLSAPSTCKPVVAADSSLHERREEDREISMNPDGGRDKSSAPELPSEHQNSNDEGNKTEPTDALLEKCLNVNTSIAEDDWSPSRQTTQTEEQRKQGDTTSVPEQVILKQLEKRNRVSKSVGSSLTGNECVNIDTEFSNQICPKLPCSYPIESLTDSGMKYSKTKKNLKGKIAKKADKQHTADQKSVITTFSYSSVPSRVIQSWEQSTRYIRHFCHGDPRRVMSTSNIHGKMCVQKVFVQKVPLCLMEKQIQSAKVSCKILSGEVGGLPDELFVKLNTHSRIPNFRHDRSSLSGSRTYPNDGLADGQALSSTPRDIEDCSIPCDYINADEMKNNSTQGDSTGTNEMKNNSTQGDAIDISEINNSAQVDNIDTGGVAVEQLIPSVPRYPQSDTPRHHRPRILNDRTSDMLRGPVFSTPRDPFDTPRDLLSSMPRDIVFCTPRDHVSSMLRDPKSNILGDPMSSMPRDPISGMPRDSMSGTPRDPVSSMLKNPMSGMPKDPLFGMAVNPKNNTPRAPISHMPRNPVSTMPNDIASNMLKDPTPSMPRDPISNMPRDPVSALATDPIYSTPRDPVPNLPRDMEKKYSTRRDAVTIDQSSVDQSCDMEKDSTSETASCILPISNPIGNPFAGDDDDDLFAEFEEFPDFLKVLRDIFGQGSPDPEDSRTDS